MTKPIILGTRGSPLALAQARQVASRIEVAHGWPAGAVELRVVRTTGDRIQDRPLAEIGGKALWTKELDAALIAGETDMSVHSMKDVESERPIDLCIAAMPRRADVRDRLIGANSIAALNLGAVVGTSSPRRARFRSPSTSTRWLGSSPNQRLLELSTSDKVHFIRSGDEIHILRLLSSELRVEGEKPHFRAKFLDGKAEAIHWFKEDGLR